MTQNNVKYDSLQFIEKHAKAALKKQETLANNYHEKRKILLKKLEEIENNLKKIAQEKKKINKETKQKIQKFATENY